LKSILIGKKRIHAIEREKEFPGIIEWPKLSTGADLSKSTDNGYRKNEKKNQ